jgi:hypothetical protein
MQAVLRLQGEEMTVDDLRKRLADNPDLAKLNGDVNPDRELEEVGRQVAIKRDGGGKRNKYGAIRVAADGYTFDSKREAAVYWELRHRQRAGEISNLQCQVKYPLVVEGVRVGAYVADFVYEEDGRTVVVDVKSKPTRTAVYRLKRKLMMALHGIEIEEME